MEILPGVTRFTIERRLGAGGFGVVYQAYDLERNARVALKTLNDFDGEGLYRFKQEFRALADIAHPNLVSLYELMSAGERLFFTMELIDGVSFLDYVRASSETKPDLLFSDKATVKVANSSSQPVEMSAPIISRSHAVLNLDRLRVALRQLSEGVYAVHQAGKLHRDLKPPNVLVTKEGRLVILDFGLVTELANEKVQKYKEIIGTPDFMSPEYAAGRSITEAADWYSVGVMLYQALTGDLPFDSTFENVLIEKQRYEPPPPAEVAPDVPEDLNSLCRDLLRIDPRKRPTGRIVLDRLGAGQTGHSRSVLSNASSINAIPLIGRKRHLAELNQAFQAIKARRSITVFVHGQAGMGKTAMVKFFLDYIQQSEPQAVVLIGRCYEQESVPYKALDSLIDALSEYLKQLTKSEIAALLPNEILALARLFPVLRQVEAVAKAERGVLEIPNSQELRQLAFTALRELLSRIANKRPLILFIDDLQWGDIDSAVLLRELISPPSPPVLMLIAAYLSEEAENSPCLKTLLPLRAKTGSLVQMREIIIGELSATEAEKMAIALLGEKQSKVPIQAIIRESGGNPYFIDEVIRHLQIGNELLLDSDIANIPLSLDEVIQARITRLPVAARKLLEVVAVAGQSVARAMACEIAEIDGGEQSALTLLRASHLVRIKWSKDQSEIETYHSRIGQTVVRFLAPDILATLHNKLALALEYLELPDPERLVLHFRKAGNIEKAAKYAVAAAQQADEALAFDRAARLYQLVLELMMDKSAANFEPAQKHRIRLKLAEALANAGRSAESAEVYLVVATEVEAAQVLEFQRRAAEQFLRSGLIDKGIATLRMVLQTMGVKLADTPRKALLSLMLRRAQLWLRGLHFRERDEAEISPEDLTRIDAYYSVADGFAIVDVIHGADFQTRHLLMALNIGEPYRVARALAFEAFFNSALGGRGIKKTRQRIYQATKIAERINHAHAIGVTTLVAGQAAFLVGHWQRAYELCERAGQILRERCTGVAHELGAAQVFMLRSLFFLGKLTELAIRLSNPLKGARQRGDLYDLTNFRTRIEYTVLLAADESEQARQTVDDAIKQWSQKGFHVQHFFALVAQVEIALYRGENLVAWQLIDERWPAIKQSLLLRVQFILIEMLHLRARARVALGTSISDSKLLAAGERDAKRIERENMPYGNALALLVRANIVANRGTVKDAEQLLNRAEQIFDKADMGLYLAVARRRRGQLIGGEEGRLLIIAADKSIADEKILKPASMADMLAPGRWEKNH